MAPESSDYFEVFQTWKRSYLPSYSDFVKLFPGPAGGEKVQTPLEVNLFARSLKFRMDKFKADPGSLELFASTVVRAIQYGEFLESYGFVINKQATSEFPEDLRHVVEAAQVHAT